MEENISFKIKLERILDVLCSEIYDSPLALLRENVQNAYDATLMRLHKGVSVYHPQINVTITHGVLTIEDNGIGMNAESLKKNYWTAGSSGKNNADAYDAGVVGTFGIGAMANFGVCSEVKVVTRAYEEAVTYTSQVKKAELSLDEKCIKIVDNQDQRSDYGTKITATLDEGFSITEEDAIGYLAPYVQFVPVPIIVNGKNISQHTMALPENSDKTSRQHGTKREGDLSFSYDLAFNKFSNVAPQILISNITALGERIGGEIMLKSSMPVLYGLRNYFGLAPIPVSSIFNFGGTANLSNLTPTAGREAVSRESIHLVSRIVQMADEIIARAISGSEMADQSRELLQYIRKYRRYDLADNIQISVSGTDQRMRLSEVKRVVDGKHVSYYTGQDKQIQSNYDDGNHILLIPANDNTRRQIQLAVLKQKQIDEIPDTVDVRLVDNQQLSIPELSIMSRIKTVLSDDYLMSDITVRFATISHNLTSTVRKEGNVVCIYLTQESSEVNYLTQIYKQDFSFFEPMIKDFVRAKLYTKLAPYIPSSTKQGAEALYNILQRKRELYTIEYSELGEMESVMKSYLDGKIAYKEVLKAASGIKKKQTQSVGSNQVGDIGVVLPQGNHPIEHRNHEKMEDAVSDNQSRYDAMPPIMRLDTSCEKYKVLHSDSPEYAVNGFNTFLAFSDRMYKENYEFFLQPHTTRIIWSMHKIIYIFTHASNNLTIYYDIDLSKKLEDNSTGGRMIPTTTIITKDKILVPVIPEMSDYFNIKGGQLRFSVRFDSVNQ
jgi:molecular chaperone HtpG